MPTIIDGTTGVDKVQAGAIEASDIPDASLPVAKLSATGTANNTTFLRGDGSWQTISTSPTTDQVLSATAGASVGAVGTYALARNNAIITPTLAHGEICPEMRFLALTAELAFFSASPNRRRTPPCNSNTQKTPYGPTQSTR